MLKNNSLLAGVYGILFLLIIGVFFLSKFKSADDTFVFPYPETSVEFAGTIIPMQGDNFYNKQRFDKEFLNASNNLYQFYLYVKRYPEYIPYLEEKLKEAGIHDDFKYLPIAESALRDDVVSSAGAGGIWQFMPETAKRYGLLVNDDVDQRYDFELATDAAITYIGDLHDKFGDWALVAAAYNRGENGLARDMESQDIDNYYDLYLNDETSRYVFRITAIKYVLESYFDRKELIDRLIGGVSNMPETEFITVGKIEDISSWAQSNGYIYNDVRILNRWILGNNLPEGDWKVKILKK